jgi:hypothetical protein
VDVSAVKTVLTCQHNAICTRDQARDVSTHHPKQLFRLHPALTHVIMLSCVYLKRADSVAHCA